METTELNIIRIEKAKIILSKMFKLKKYYLENNINRKHNIVEARRFLIYYMKRELYIPYNRIKDYIKGTHHATAIHHCHKLDELMQLKSEKKLREKYSKFLVLANNLDVLEELLIIKRDQTKFLNSEIEEINNQIKLNNYRN